MQLYDRIQEAVQYLETHLPKAPKICIASGTGQDKIFEQLSELDRIPYKDIPHLADPTVQSHEGALRICVQDDEYIILFSGRLHYYEGYSPEQITFPIRIAQGLNCPRLILCNVVGSVNPTHQIGDLFCAEDHIFLQAHNPLRGANDERLGPRFPDMSEVYDPLVNTLMESICQKQGLSLHKGVYACLSGPNLETKAEYTFLHRIGADVVGMSSVPEVIVAKHAGIKVNMISTISNVCYPPERVQKTSLQSVIEAAQNAEPKLSELLRQLLPILMKH